MAGLLSPLAVEGADADADVDVDAGKLSFSLSLVVCIELLNSRFDGIPVKFLSSRLATKPNQKGIKHQVTESRT